jgi:putative transposase
LLKTTSGCWWSTITSRRARKKSAVSDMQISQERYPQTTVLEGFSARRLPQIARIHAGYGGFAGPTTYLPTQLRGKFFYLYLFVDLFSRKVVGWQVFDSESAEQAAQLLQDICLRRAIAPNQLTVHSDNGSPMKGETMLATMQRLGVAHSRSRPSVSNDNPYSESLFKTLKYRPQLPLTAFADLLCARRWVAAWVRWYNEEHRHSAIRYVTPNERHARLDEKLLQARAEVYESARQKNPLRWSKQTRDWGFIDTVTLNPDTPQLKEPEAAKQAA